jgi:hypothetical protein
MRNGLRIRCANLVFLMRNGLRIAVRQHVLVSVAMANRNQVSCRGQLLGVSLPTSPAYANLPSHFLLGAGDPSSGPTLIVQVAIDRARW